MIILYTVPRHRNTFDGISSSGTRIPVQNLNQMQDAIEPRKQFRPQLHSNFESRTDDTMDLLDAVCRYTGAKPIVELSPNPFLPRNYGRIHDNIQQFPAGAEQLLKGVTPKNSC